MTEEIIIDGVNVAGCEFYSNITKYCNEANVIDGWQEAYECSINTCANCPNCYYKQLKRLEQENKELKEQNETLNYQWHKQSEIGDEWYKVAEKYKSVLEKIRNVLKEICKEECDYTKPKFCGDCDCRYGQILNKINEVLNDNN